MKRLNRKGFTLVELLAVIIILAIVVGITIPAILTTTAKARDKAFQASIDSFANWLDRQYEAYNLGNELIMQVDTNYTNDCIKNGSPKERCKISRELLQAGGLKPSNYNWNTELKNPNVIALVDGKYNVRLYGSKSGDYATEEAKNNNQEYFNELDSIKMIGNLSRMNISKMSGKEIKKAAKKK